MSGTIHRRVAALEARRAPAPSYVIWLSDEDLASPAAVGVAIAEHQRRTGWTGPVILAPPEATMEEWMAAQRAGL
ncbi:hypothetical protein [Belnapia rosea]|uniref:Uncharacterized protein n=1 Tax=Belnapia rosea TaxID=938405 RepID=A0A1G6YV25_9PROT|nr:hypothetical protein [Belnapia rosea]SDD94151.1 hypothetical protein SAMN04487779_101516 [Belnapia rosea]